MIEERRQFHARQAAWLALVSVLAGYSGYTTHDRNLTADDAARMSAKRDQTDALYDELRKESAACLQRQIDRLENKL